MDQNIYDNDFEEFLRQKSDQYKIYPADKVWNNIYSNLHGRKKWWAMGLFVVLMGTGLMVQDGLRKNNHPSLAGNNSESAQPADLNAATLSDNSSTSAGTPLSPLDIRNNGIAGITDNFSGRFSAAIAALSFPVTENKTAKNSSEKAGHEQLVPHISAGSNEISPVIENEPIPAASLPAQQEASASSIDPVKAPKEQPSATIKSEQKNIATANTEFAATVLTPKTSRWGVRLFASPMVSYRRLSTMDGTTAAPSPVSAGGNINKYVRHQPAPGFELGATLQYKLSNSLTLYTGAQVNYSRYYIDAYRYRKEKASIAVNNASMHDTLSGYTDIRNFSGYAPEQLQNSYLQLSLPVGMEIKLIGQKKWQFSIAGDIQPSFVLSSNCYLISSDYKNYIQSPDLARSFNVHSNFEAILSYQTGSLKWQFGPQYRTQLLSSYSNQYRVREYLTEYGFKFGVVKSF